MQCPECGKTGRVSISGVQYCTNCGHAFNDAPATKSLSDLKAPTTAIPASQPAVPTTAGDKPVARAPVPVRTQAASPTPVSVIVPVQPSKPDATSAPAIVATPTASPAAANPAQDFHANPVIDLRKIAPIPAATASPAPIPTPAPAIPQPDAEPVPIAAEPIAVASELEPTNPATPSIIKSRQDARQANAAATSRSNLIQKFSSHTAPVTDVSPEAITPQDTTVPINSSPPTPAPVMPDAPTVPIIAKLEASDLVAAAPKPAAPPKPVSAPTVAPLVPTAPAAEPLDLTKLGQPNYAETKIPSSPYPTIKSAQTSPVVDALAPMPTAVSTNQAAPVAPSAAPPIPTPMPVAAPPAPQPTPVATSAVLPPMVSTAVEANKQLLTPEALAQADPATARKQAFALAMANAPQRNNATSAIAAAVAILVMGGYIWTQNAPKLALHTASNKAGFEASLPTYIPSNYASHRSVESAPGKVSLTFSSPGSNTLSITQEKSPWDPKSLLDNFVAKQSNNYLAVTGQGLVIYIYNNDVATWVNRGIWYSIHGNDQLNREQILKIAYGL